MVAGLLTGKVVNDYIQFLAPFRYVSFAKQGRLLSRFLNITVDRYLNKHANISNPVCKEIYKEHGIVPGTKVKTLAAEKRLILSLYTALSYTQNFIFDLQGIGPAGGEYIYKLVKDIVAAGGAAILIDRCNEFKDDCTCFIEAKYAGTQFNYAKWIAAKGV